MLLLCLLRQQPHARPRKLFRVHTLVESDYEKVIGFSSSLSVPFPCSLNLRFVCLSVCGLRFIWMGFVAAFLGGRPAPPQPLVVWLSELVPFVFSVDRTRHGVVVPHAFSYEFWPSTHPLLASSLMSCPSILPAFVKAGSMVCSVVLCVGTAVVDTTCDASISPVSWVHIFSALCLFVGWYSTSDVALHVVSVRFSVKAPEALVFLFAGFCKISRPEPQVFLNRHSGFSRPTIGFFSSDSRVFSSYNFKKLTNHLCREHPGHCHSCTWCSGIRLLCQLNMPCWSLAYTLLRLLGFCTPFFWPLPDFLPVRPPCLRFGRVNRFNVRACVLLCTVLGFPCTYRCRAILGVMVQCYSASVV